MADSIPAERGVSNRVVFKCDLGESRIATRILRAFLAEQGLDESEQFSCELCLAEACNNAVQHVTAEGAKFSIIAEAMVHSTGVELRVTDRTAGFELGAKCDTLSADRENGRGIFIIQSLMDEVRYFRG